MSTLDQQQLELDQQQLELVQANHQAFKKQKLLQAREQVFAIQLYNQELAIEYVQEIQRKAKAELDKIDFEIRKSQEYTPRDDNISESKQPSKEKLLAIKADQCEDITKQLEELQQQNTQFKHDLTKIKAKWDKGIRDELTIGYQQNNESKPINDDELEQQIKLEQQAVEQDIEWVNDNFVLIDTPKLSSEPKPTPSGKTTTQLKDLKFVPKPKANRSAKEQEQFDQLFLDKNEPTEQRNYNLELIIDALIRKSESVMLTPRGNRRTYTNSSRTYLGDYFMTTSKHHQLISDMVHELAKDPAINRLFNEMYANSHLATSQNNFHNLTMNR